MRTTIIIYIISLVACFVAIGERLYQEKKYDKDHNNKLLFTDIIVSVAPVMNTYYVVKTIYSVVTELIKIMKK